MRTRDELKAAKANLDVQIQKLKKQEGDIETELEFLDACALVEKYEGYREISKKKVILEDKIHHFVVRCHKMDLSHMNWLARRAEPEMKQVAIDMHKMLEAISLKKNSLITLSRALEYETIAIRYGLNMRLEGDEVCVQCGCRRFSDTETVFRITLDWEEGSYFDHGWSDVAVMKVALDLVQPTLQSVTLAVTPQGIARLKKDVNGTTKGIAESMMLDGPLEEHVQKARHESEFRKYLDKTDGNLLHVEMCMDCLAKPSLTSLLEYAREHRRSDDQELVKRITTGEMEIRWPKTIQVSK